ncbi:hypothetical protein BT67DRAFT_443581 [Trichocladium antarcticum]|uniref:Uncharacterized protein n=1 Tax=Trichocladium antarcticum TaxID=1450529 RepID=A0AAN6UGP3_9PEZI|nr:hypothetical protein BT67DRAFT_443581 [Trichocladium antarcticum]
MSSFEKPELPDEVYYTLYAILALVALAIRMPLTAFFVFSIGTIMNTDCLLLMESYGDWHNGHM